MSVGAHVAPWGKTTELFTQAANAFNGQRGSPFQTDAKALQDRFHLLVSKFEREVHKRADATGVDEELSPRDVLLQNAADVIQGHREKAEKERKERTAAEERLVQAGQQVRAMALAHRQDPLGSPGRANKAESGAETAESSASEEAERRGRVRRRATLRRTT